MSDCNVCIDQSDGDEAEFWNVTTVKGRKVHVCYECADQIPVGVEHQRIAMKYDGTFGSYRTCLACVEIHRALSCDGYRCTGILWEDIREYVFPEMTLKCIDKCQTVEARKKLSARWNEWKFR